MVKGSGKKGGIPKSFHAKQKESWQKVGKKTGQNYFTWIAAKWKAEKARGSVADYAKGKKATSSKAKPRSKLTPKTNLNLPPNPWVKKWASGNLDEYKDWKKTLKKKPSKKEMLSMMKEKQWPHDAVNCWQLRRAKMNCMQKNISNTTLVKSKLRSRGFPYESWWGDGETQSPKPSSSAQKPTTPSNPISQAVGAAVQSMIGKNIFIGVNGEYPPPPGTYYLQTGPRCIEVKYGNERWVICGAPRKDAPKRETAKWIAMLEGQNFDAYNRSNYTKEGDEWHFAFNTRLPMVARILIGEDYQKYIDFQKNPSLQPESLAENLLGDGVPVKPEPQSEGLAQNLLGDGVPVKPEPDDEGGQGQYLIFSQNGVDYDVWAPNNAASPLTWAEWVRSEELETQVASNQGRTTEQHAEKYLDWLYGHLKAHAPKYKWGQIINKDFDLSTVGGAFSRRRFRK